MNEMKNPGFEMTMMGGNPPYDPPTDYSSFLAFFNPGFQAGAYNNYATQQNGTDIYPTQVKYPGHMMSTGLKMWGAGVDAGGGKRHRSLGTIYQEWPNGVVPTGKKLVLTGWGYHFSGDALQADSQVYLVIKCFTDQYGETCGAGGQKSMMLTGKTEANKWKKYEATVDSLSANTKIVQAGVEFEECATGDCDTVGGAIFWDGLHFSIQ